MLQFFCLPVVVGPLKVGIRNDCLASSNAVSVGVLSLNCLFALLWVPMIQLTLVKQAVSAL